MCTTGPDPDSYDTYNALMQLKQLQNTREFLDKQIMKETTSDLPITGVVAKDDRPVPFTCHSSVATLHAYTWARLPEKYPAGTIKELVTLPVTYIDPDTRMTRAGRMALCAYETYETYAPASDGGPTPYYAKPASGGTRHRPLRWDELPEADLDAAMP